MNKRWNINVILCEKTDVDVVNIKNIFDTLHIRDNKASFSMVTFINGIKIDEEVFGLYYFMEKLEDDRALRTYLGSSLFKQTEENNEGIDGEKLYNSVEDSSILMSSARFDDIEFKGPGSYELQVYKYDNDKAIDIDNKDSESCDEWANEENLVSIYPFRVKLFDN